ncbi:MAG TPA: LuxR C-terminal-related transcriptional regulator [Acidimicrobiales bacterium]|nr:LuxR C-terminal-related transcriptional regulator [Acidimicrobiales bacterium]
MTQASTGTVTFLFTDVEGATVLWEDHAADVEAALARHDEILRAAFADRGGRVFATSGDGFGVVFDHARDAVDAAVLAQRALAAETWPGDMRLRARMGLETGTARERDGSYLGPVPNRAARIMAAAHGGQVLVGARTASLLDGDELVDLGDHRLPDLPRAERLFQVHMDGAPSQFPVPRTHDAHRGNLPMPTASLIGRERVLADIIELVRANRLVTLTGVGGVGKTRLSIEVGAALTTEHPDGVWMVELAPLTDATAVPDLIATTLGITPRAGIPVIHAVADALSGRRTLVVLDNCEHVVDAVAETLRELIARTSTLRVLATSREAIDVAGEQRRLVLPLALDGGVSSPAVTLFVERARALQSRIDFDETATAAAVVEICRSLDGLPLGIELAAARTISMSPIDIRDRLGDRFRILTSSPRAPRRQQTLRDVVAWSYELLDDDERALLCHAAVFAGGFDLAAITDVLGSDDDLVVLDLIDSLVRKSLVTADNAAGTARYVLLETIRQFAEDELAATSSLDAVRDRHAERFAHDAVARWARWNGPTWRDCVDWLEIELANLRAAFRWSWARGDIEIAADIAAHSALMGASIQLFETVGWAQELLDDATRADVRHLPRLYTGAAWGCFTGRPAEAVVAAQTAGKLERDPRYEPCEPGLSGLIEALAHVYAGHLDRYVDAAERVVALPGNARAWGLSLLLDGLQASGRVDEALALTDEAMAAARALGNPYFIAYAYWTAGGAHTNTDPDRALALWREGLDYVHQHRVDFFVGFIARDAARLRLVDANPDDALTMFDAAIDAFQQAGNVAQLTITLASATALFERIDRLDSAATLYAAIVRQPGSAHHVPDLPELAGRLAAKLGDAAFRARGAEGAGMDLGDTALFARHEIQRARAELRANAASREARPGGLSAREVDVLRLAAKGHTTREIAEQLYISAKTADRHIQNLYTKIGASNRAAATRWAVEHGLD